MLKMIVVLLVFFLFAACLLVRSKNIHYWLLGYIQHQLKLILGKKKQGLVHVIFCLVDHFEPKWENPVKEVEIQRVKTWVNEYPKIVDKHVDGDGITPQHTWFYPAEEYEYEYLEMLSSLCKKGYGEIELHLHHHDDTSEGVTQKINDAIKNYRKHGIFETINNPSQITYGFIHGNWALDNSNKDGIQCGVNNEIIILKETGCYADFTLPSAPSSCQTKKINSIYYAVDNPEQPKSHNTGIDVEVGKTIDSDLMIIQGPLTLNWRRRKFGLFPRIENSEISGTNPATKERIDLWIKQQIHIKGKEDWIFIKAHCHGAQEPDHGALLGKKVDNMYSYLERNIMMG